MEFIIISLKNKLKYRNIIVFSVIGAIMDIYIKIALWKYLYQSDTAMTEYMTLYTILSNIIAMFYINTISQKISDKLTDGSIAIDLLKPIGFLRNNYMQCLGEMLGDLLLKGIPILLFYGIYLWKYSRYIVYQQIIATVIAVSLGHILYIQIFTIIGLIAIVSIEIWAFHRIVNDIIFFLSGAFIPLSLFPYNLYNINLLMPFRFLFSFPLELVLQRIDIMIIFYNFGILCGWIVFLGVIIWKLKRIMMVKLVIQGG